MRRGALPLTICAVVGAMAAAHCGSEEPTQIVVHVDTTPEECGAIQKTIVRVGSFEDYDSPAAAEKTGCDPTTNRIGTFVLVPKGAHDAEVMFQIITGIAKNADECRPENRVDCIFAKRQLRYVPHETLEVTVLMAGACRGKTCQANETCDPSGQCVSAVGGSSPSTPPARADAGGTGDAMGTPQDRCVASGCTTLEGAVCRPDGVCEVECGTDQRCNLTCPPGVSCVFKCLKANSCDIVKCEASSPSCDVQCIGRSACNEVTCSSDACKLKCDRQSGEGSRACEQIRISSKNDTTIECAQSSCGDLHCTRGKCTCAPSKPDSCDDGDSSSCTQSCTRSSGGGEGDD